MIYFQASRRITRVTRNTMHNVVNEGILPDVNLVNLEVMRCHSGTAQNDDE